MKTNMLDMAGGPVLGGAPQGRKAFARLAEVARAEPLQPTAWLWDFRGVLACSPSFTRECFLALQGLLKARRSMLWPVIANANADVREDLRVMLKEVGTAMVICSYDDKAGVSGIGLFGAVDGYLETTFARVLEFGETDARELKTSFGESEPIGQTAWSNRLAALQVLGALVEEPLGRVKRYRPIVRTGDKHGR